MSWPKKLLKPFSLFPVRVRRGPARGAWWSLYPCSAYWRLGGNDAEVEAVIQKYGSRPGSTCWDMGAHFGIYAVGMAMAVGPRGRVDAFEPDPVSFRRLGWHRRINRLHQLRLHEAAASDTNGEAGLYQYESFGGTSSHLPYTNETLEGVPCRTITKVRLDDWVGAGILGLPDFIKMDIEGHAGPALRGMEQTLASAHPVILVAIHTGEEFEQVSSILQRLDYACSPVSGTPSGDPDGKYFGELLCLPRNTTGAS